MSLKRPISFDHTHENVTTSYDGFMSKQDKSVLDNLAVEVGTFYSSTEIDTLLSGKQPNLVSGTNIKTVNSTSLLGSGNVAVQPTLVSGTNIKTINGATILGSGDLTVSGTDATKLPLTGGTMSGTIISTTDNIIKGNFGGVTRGFLWNNADGIGFLNSSGGWGSRIPFGTNDWYTEAGNDSERIRLRSTYDASLTSTLHAFQIGPTNSGNLIIDTNEIMARSNGSAVPLYVQGNNAGDFEMLSDSTYAGGYRAKVYGYSIVEKGNTGGVYWTKFYDGTIEYYANLVTASIACSTAMGAGGGFRTVTQSMTLPVALATTGYGHVTVTPSMSSFFNIGGGGYVNTTTTVYWYLASVTSDTTTRARTACIKVTGRWY